MTTNVRLKILLDDFEKAVSGLTTSLALNLNDYNEVEADTIKSGQIQKFEICIELGWKTAKCFLEDKKGIVVTSPKPVLKSLFTDKVIDENLYISLNEMIDDRNKLSHIYKEEMVLLILPSLSEHLKNLTLLLNVLQQQ